LLTIQNMKAYLSKKKKTLFFDVFVIMTSEYQMITLSFSLNSVLILIYGLEEMRLEYTLYFFFPLSLSFSLSFNIKH